MCHYSEIQNACVKVELYPSLFAKVNAIVLHLDEITSHTLLHMLLDNSDIPEMLCLHCFPQFLQQGIDEVHNRLMLSPSLTEAKQMLLFSLLALARGFARGSASAHASVSTASIYTNGAHISSKSGSGISHTFS
jgi:hypothetical protein